MIYELRTYWAAPGKSAALHHRFETLTLGLFQRHNMRVIGFWTPEPETPESGTLVYILAFEDEAAKEAAWAAFRADPEWIAGKTESERDGTLVEKLTSTLLSPVEYMPQMG